MDRAGKSVCTVYYGGLLREPHQAETEPREHITGSILQEVPIWSK